MHTKYLVIGVNAAGFYAIEALRKHDPYGSITAVNGEQYLPNKRTKINKHFSSGKLDIGKFKLAESYGIVSDQGILVNSKMETTVGDIYAAEDKPRAKLYGKAVNEGWENAKVLELLG